MQVNREVHEHMIDAPAPANHFQCRVCGRPCANGTGLSAHERSHEGIRLPPRPKPLKRTPIGTVFADIASNDPVTTRAADGKRVHTRCMGEFELGGLRAHLEECPLSATNQIAA